MGGDGDHIREERSDWRLHRSSLDLPDRCRDRIAAVGDQMPGLFFNGLYMSLQRHFVDRRVTLLCQAEEGVWLAAISARRRASNTGPTSSPISPTGSPATSPASKYASGYGVTCLACSAGL